MSSSERVWNARQKNREQRLARATAALGSQLQGKIAPADKLAELLYAVLENGDRVCVEGNNQKQADFLAKGLAALDPARVNGLHMLFSVLALPEHLDVFEKGIADRLDFFPRQSDQRCCPLEQGTGASKVAGAYHALIRVHDGKRL